MQSSPRCPRRGPHTEKYFNVSKKRCDDIANAKSSKSKDKKKCPNAFFTGNNIRYTNDVIHKIGVIFCHVNNMDDILGIVKEAKKNPDIALSDIYQMNPKDNNFLTEINKRIVLIKLDYIPDIIDNKEYNITKFIKDFNLPKEQKICVNLFTICYN